MTQRIIANTDIVASKVLDGEAILINLQTGVYYSFNPVAGLIWTVAAAGVTSAEAGAAVSAHFAVTADAAASDAQRFLDSLCEEGLARVTERVAAGATDLPAAPVDKPAYEVPAFEKFTDMMEMFALDPPLPGLTRQQD